MFPRWLKRILSKFGFNFPTAFQEEQDDFFALSPEEEEETEGPSEPPPLEDVSYLLQEKEATKKTAQAQDTNRVSSQSQSQSFASVNNSSSGVPTPPLSSSPPYATISALNLPRASQFHNEPLSRQNSINSTCSTASTRNKDRHVYDPVYGVIPQETRDLWHAQEEDAGRKKAFVDAQIGSKHIPPVRFTTGKTSSVS